MPQLEIKSATTAADIAAVVALCWAYRAFLLGLGPAERLITQTFYPEDVFAARMAHLTETHARPREIILLARLKGAAIGCGMSHALSRTDCEIKRLFVTPEARGSGAGKALCAALLNQARADGFDRVLLDTSRGLTAARRLYKQMGFVECGPYQDLPKPARNVLCFYERNLGAAPAT